VLGLRVKHTPVPDVSPMLPNTMDCTVTAVPFVQRYKFEFESKL
jgi:hypothetical protein